ncbi:MAG TPA: hypothetical protein VJ021_08035 [Thermoplasmata archaeon]|nr:hypothetical protein [Thermoplasmata archaeon]
MDLDHLNEEVRTRAYLSYFSNARSQIEDQSRKINFLQRIQDEESGGLHFRINARQVFSDPEAYKKLMPWIETLMDIAKESAQQPDDPRTIGELVPELLARERHLTSQMEQGLIELRGGFATGGKSPLSLEAVTYAFPVEWTIAGSPITWHGSQPSDREPLRRDPEGSKTLIDIPIHLCSICRKIIGTH